VSVAGGHTRAPTGVIGTNKADAAETAAALLADLAGGPAAGDTPLPRPGLLRLPSPDDPPAPESGPAPAIAAVLAARGIRPVSYADWLRVSAAEESLALALARGDRVKLPSSEHLWAASRP
jgi:ferredoxin--NADP+ reductase